MEKTLNLGSIFSSLFGIVVAAIGIINTFWGNDPGYGVFILLLSLVYFPPATTVIERMTGRAVSVSAKVLLGIFILWTALGVAELSDKIDLMLMDLYV